MGSQMTDGFNKDPKKRIMDVANRLFYADGVRATGTERIIEESDVAKATFYRHFSSKDQLVLAYLDSREHDFWRFLFNPPRPSNIREVIKRIDEMVNQPDVSGCPFLKVASEFPNKDSLLHKRVQEQQDHLLAYLVEVLGVSYPDPEGLAVKLLTVIDGALSIKIPRDTLLPIPLKDLCEAVIVSIE